jgi:hypothetical protein
MEGRLGRLTPELTWTEPDSQVLAERVWELMARRPQPLASMWRRLNYSSLSFLEVVSILITTGQSEWLETPSPDNVVETTRLPKP